MAKGKVKRPVYGSGDGSLTLTATVKKGSVTKTKQFSATVKQAGMTDNQKVIADKNWLAIFPTTDLTSDLMLPSTGPNGSTISWASDKENVIATNGKINRPANGQPTATVKLTATIQSGTVQETKEFTVTVKPWTNQEEVDLDAAYLTFDNIRGNNLSKNEIVYDLVLPTKGPRNSTITWTSTAPATMSNAGKLTRPTYTQGDVMFSLTAVVTKGDVSKTVQLLAFKAVKLPITNLEAVALAATLIDASVIKGDNVDLNNIINDMILPKTVTNYNSDLNTVLLTWEVYNADGTAASPNNPNCKLVDNSGFYLCDITRPAVGQTNATVTLKMTASSSAASGAEGSTYKTFKIIIPSMNA